MKQLSSVLFALLAVSAHASPVTMSITSYEHGASTIRGTMTIDPPGALTSTVSSGASGVFLAVNDGVFTDSFLAYCIELLAPAANWGVSVNYTQNSEPALAVTEAPFTTLQTDRLTKLFVKNARAGGGLNGSTTNAVNAGAMQLAVWEILYDGADFGNLSGGQFYANAGSASNGAENLITGLDSYDIGGFSASFMSFNNGSASNRGNQDFLSVKLTPAPVSEPGTLAMVGIGLLCLSLLSVRSQCVFLGRKLMR